jgi:hypothetical protein
MRKIYAKPGGYWQWSFENPDPNAPAPDVPDDVVLMSEDRPGEDYICRSNFNGTGDWVRKRDAQPTRTAIKKVWSFCTAPFRKVYVGYFWCRWFFRVLRFRWITHNRGFPLIRSTSPISNWFTSFDYRKAVDALCFVLPLLVVNFSELSQGIVYDLLLATAAAAVFDALINVPPREQDKLANANVISKVLYELVLVKNHQYRMIGYFPDPFWLSDSELPDDMGMTRQKGRTLMQLMGERWESNYDGARPMLPRSLDSIEGESIQAFFMRSHAYLYQQVTKLQGVAKPELFPSFTRTLNDIHEHLQQSVQSINFINPQRYVTEQFKFIESLQLHFKVECHRYLGGEFNARLILNGAAVKELMSIHPIYFYADPRNYPD